ncbi:unnamed protein product [Adineta steineri]|uniref:Uncharacterized protein n=1 Tax=Adineta steineri TaxID=433720 RepID=A0A814LWK9_9BILA|nr:unnamed protein product [Adineta steineri]
MSKTAPYNDNNNCKRRSSRLEWVESSWTRLLSMLCWCWIYPTLSLGYKHQLTQNDLDDIPNVDKSTILLDRLCPYIWSTTTTTTTTTTTSRIVIKEFWKDFLFASLFSFPLLIVRIAQPLLLRQIILDMMIKKESNSLTYVWAIILFMCIIIQTFTNRQIIFQTARVGVRIRNALIIIIYKHSLSLKAASWQQIDTGEIITLITNDTSKFEEVCENLIYLFLGIIEAIIIFGLLCWMIHPIPTICGYISFPIFILIQLYFSYKFGQQREITSQWTNKRVQAFNEFIHGCSIIKMYNWEKSMENRICEIRENELINIRRASYFRALNVTQFVIAGSLLALTIFGSAWLLNCSLHTANIFPVLSCIALMRVNIFYYLPVTIEKLSEVKFASRRIDLFMILNNDKQYDGVPFISSINKQEKGNITMSNASFSWHDKIPCLTSLNLNVEQGTFIGIAGPVGSGKSSLLAAILGEMNIINGELLTNNSSFSYTAQSSYIFSDTIRNNILLNQSYDEQRYKNIINACCLNLDLNQFGSSGDLTIIGEKGANLSGGQRARLSLARALYIQADIYLLDDPISAVDNKVAEQIYEQCISPRGLLKNKTRLLVTHQTQFLSEANQIIHLSHGHIDEQDYLNEQIPKEEDDANKTETSLLTDMLDQHKETSVVDTQSIIMDENPLNINVEWSVWYRLFSSSPSGKFGFFLLILLIFLSEILYDGTNYWLSMCLEDSSMNEQIPSLYAYIYFSLILFTILMNIMRTNYYFRTILNGSNKLHNNMLKGLLYTSVQFFESNPSGRILNRISKDQHIIDELLPPILLEAITVLSFAVGSIFIICFIDPSLCFFLIILAPIIWWIIVFYQKSSRQLKHLESITHSSVYALFSSSINGWTTIRAFKAENYFIELISDKIDTNTCAYISRQAASQWFTVTLNSICCSILLITSIRIVLFHNELNLSKAALSLLSAMSVSAWFQWGVRQLSEATALMTSAERIHAYSQLRPEEDHGGHDHLIKTSPKWPNHGAIELQNYSLRHRFNSEYTIKNINLRIDAGQKIGIIGRTGAGKSSLFKGLFRLINRSCIDGKILIDDVDTSRVTLNHLRSNLSIIPQHPVLFSGTLQYNLDPFNEYSHEQCWSALEDVQLKQFVKKHPAGLSMSISESGNNLSVGQCQLICMARAILKKSKILLIDEATANVDKKTDNLIQTVINNRFRDRTVLIIAHRLNTLVNSDRILVLDNGKIVNYDIPTNILQSF